MDHMHNNVHDWVGGQMDDVPSAVNDPIFNLHHCNVDRIFESWLQRYAEGQSSPELLPAYVTVSGGHPGHNRDDFLVPFVPLITAGGQYQVAREWGYSYDELIPALIADEAISTCIGDTCPICDANTTCIDCTNQQTCPAPYTLDLADDADKKRTLSDDKTALGLAVGLGGPLCITSVIIIVGTITLIGRKLHKS